MKTLIYTCNFGGYEEFPDHKYQLDVDSECVVFTDDFNLRAKNWHVYKVGARFGTDPIRDSRFHKIMAPNLFPEYERSLYLDNSVLLKTPPCEFLELFLGSCDIGICSHSYRGSVLSEFYEVLELGLDDPARIMEQLMSYEQVAPDILSARPYWCGIIARLHNPRVSEVMLRWWEEVLRYSRRDQLSINRVLSESKILINRVCLDNFESAHHQWPLDLKRNGKIRSQDLLVSNFKASQMGRAAKNANVAEKLAANFNG